MEEFKKTYGIESDRGLLTWSGKAIRDMAKKIDPEFLEEYEQTFRLCSRFSHPSILGDQEYIIKDDRSLMFSPLPSEIGLVVNVRKASKYILDYLRIVEDLFAFEKKARIEELSRMHKDIFDRYASKETSAAKTGKKTDTSIRESVVAFHILE